MYVGQKGDNMKKCFGQHKYDITKMPDENELAKHFKTCKHVTEDNLESFIIDHGLCEQNTRKRAEDRTICWLQTMQTMGISGLTELVDAYAYAYAYANDMYCSKSTLVLNSKK